VAALSHRPVSASGPDFKVKSSLNFEPRSRRWNQNSMAKCVCVGPRVNARYRGSPVETERTRLLAYRRRFAGGGLLWAQRRRSVSSKTFSNRRWRGRVKQSALRRLVRGFRSGSVDSVRETILQWIVNPSTIIGSISNKAPANGGGSVRLRLNKTIPRTPTLCSLPALLPSHPAVLSPPSLPPSGCRPSRSANLHAKQ